MSLITATKPARLTKHYAVDDTGELRKDAGGALSEGHVEPVEVNGVAGFAELVAGLRTDQALAYGLPDASAKILTQDAWAEQGRPTGVITRTREHFAYAPRPGVLMLDYDPHEGQLKLDRDELVAAVRKAVPGLWDALMLYCPSSSSHIVNSVTGEDLTGLRGQRLYLPVADATDILRAGKAMVEHLWAEGHGWFEVSKSGSLLDRTIFDATVWQPERLDFAAGASCASPLRQERGAPVVIDGEVEIVDTATASPDPDTAIRAAAEANRVKARKAVADEAAEVRETWIDERLAAMMTSDADDVQRDAARTVLNRALDHRVLAGDFTIHVEVGREIREVTVGTILDNPVRWHGLRTLDPLEPEYGGGRLVGKIYAYGSRPTLHSFAHGGVAFRLIRQPARIELVRGHTHDATNAALGLLWREPDIFDFGGQLVSVNGGRVVSLDRHALAHELGGRTQFWRWHKLPNGALIEVDEDPPPRLCEQILALGDSRALRRLEAVVTAPTLRPDGTVIAVPGFDEATGILYECEGEPPEVPTHPTVDEAGIALRDLLRPFRDFPLAGQVDRGVLLAALITAVVRPALPMAPGFAADAPAQGSGKTLLMLCIGALATGHRPEVWPHTAGRDDEETRKRLLAVLRTGTGAILWDNILGSFDSAALAATMTSPSFSDRLLGKSETVTVPNRAMLLFSGNNLSIVGDLARRILTLRIDPRTEQPWARQFDLDPFAYVLRERPRMVAAAVTLVRAWLTSGAERAPGRMASFEAWDDLVRQTVVWAGHALEEGIGDPMDAVAAVQGDDPERENLGALLAALRVRFGDEEFTAADVKAVVDEAERSHGSATPVEIAARLREIVERPSFSVVSVGRILKHRRGRIVDGLRIEYRTGRSNSAVFRIVSTLGAGARQDDGVNRDIGVVPPSARGDANVYSKWRENSPPTPTTPSHPRTVVEF